MKFVIIIISMVLVNNYPLAQFLGICPFLGVSKDLDSSTGMGIAVTGYRCYIRYGTGYGCHMADPAAAQ